MKVLGEGESNGAISILHALGLGRGCSLGIQLTTNVQIVEDASEIEDDSKDQGTILHEIQAGYMLGERLLRPALVSVSKKKASKDQENIDKKDEK